MSDLTDEAKAAIAEAVRIVREDKFEAFVRGRVKPPEGNGPPAPPAKPEEPPEPPKEKKGLWWGDQLKEPPAEPPKPPEGSPGDAAK